VYLCTEKINNFKVNMDNNRPLWAHLSMLLASIFWGLMSPIGSDAMKNGITGIDLVTFRVAGGAVLFWITSLFVKREYVPTRDILLFICAGVFGLVCNQCCFTIGLSITSPVNASIVTITSPIFALILAAIILKEPITGKKALGVLMGCCGALILILSSVAANSSKVGNIKGDLLCLFAQFSFALYLTLFSNLIRRYSVFTVNKWMFTFATMMILPFSFHHVASIDFASVPSSTWIEAAYVVVFGTYVCYILTMNGQHTLRPTVVSIYNYVQPIVAVTVSIIAGMAVFQWNQALAVVLIFTGVWFVVKSRSRHDMAAEKGKKPIN
jgi:drug/metabolite transporter (DMT)-like permease